MISNDEIKQKYSEICNKYKIKGTIEEFCKEIKNYLLPLKDDSHLTEIIYKEVEATYIHHHNRAFAGITTKKFVEDLTGEVNKKLEELI